MSSDEVPDLAEPIHDALIAFTGCVGESVDDICSYGLTIGESYVPFDPAPGEDCDAEDVMCSQVWVRVMGANPLYQNDGFGGECGGVLQIELEVGVLRCIEIPEDGEAPNANDVLVAAMQAMSDMKAIQCAAVACEAWDSLTIGQWTPTGPLGGQYGGIWTFTVEV